MIAVEPMIQQAVRDSVVKGALKHALALSAPFRVLQIWPLRFSHGFPAVL